MKYVFVVFAVLLGLLCFHRIAVWSERRGWIYYRTRRGRSGSLGNAFLEVQGIFEPSTRHVLEERVKDDREADESGDPPDAGRSGPVQHGDPAAAPLRRR